VGRPAPAARPARIIQEAAGRDATRPVARARGLSGLASRTRAGLQQLLGHTLDVRGLNEALVRLHHAGTLYLARTGRRYNDVIRITGGFDRFVDQP